MILYNKKHLTYLQNELKQVEKDLKLLSMIEEIINRKEIIERVDIRGRIIRIQAIIDTIEMLNIRKYDLIMEISNRQLG